MEYLTPTDQEVYNWLLSTLKHSIYVEDTVHHLGLKCPDPQRPHDLVGPGNKYEWAVIKGFALNNRDPKVDFNTYIKPALEAHREGQYHHQKWNGDKPSADASEADMILGAIDAVCSLREPRGYQGGMHSWDDVIEISKKNPAHKVPYMLKMIPLMREIEQPDLESITSLSNIPNIGLDQPVYEIIVARTNEAVEMLRNEHGYVF